MTQPERVMRTMKYSFIAAVVLLIVVAIRVPSTAPHAMEQSMEVVLVLVAIIDLALGLFGRRFFAKLSNSRRMRNANSPQLNQWTTGNIFSLACIFSSALFGFVLHTLRGRTVLVELLFAASLVVLLLWNPGTAPAASNAGDLSR